MSYSIDRKFVFLVASKLLKFKQKTNSTFVFRCIFCGDSKKNKNKARGYFYKGKQGLAFRCHNCSIGMSFANFLNKIDGVLYKEYQIERFKEEHNSPGVKKYSFDEFKTKKPTFNTGRIIGIPSIRSLPESHSAKKYILSRKIPDMYLDELFYADDFLEFCDTFFVGHDKKLIKEDPRIVIPFYSKEGVIHGVQGRALLPNSKVRYITIKKTDAATKLFGLNHIDLSKTIYVTEGPFDSMFIENAIATMDSMLTSVFNTLGDYDYVFIYDNQPRNAQIVKNMANTIEADQKVMIWPSVEGKDINELILSGMTQEQLSSMIAENTFQGLKAKLQFSKWSKV